MLNQFENIKCRGLRKEDINAQRNTQILTCRQKKD